MNYIEEYGFDVDVFNVMLMFWIKDKYGVVFNYCLCYMVLFLGGFVFEGYILVKFI